ncbi:16S rRNA (cytosine1402-N4)-methyltransferase [Breznakibacter xylanolyticus]|uniref:Ribosomal RNA small subunit methyltransferase H n=1 Tax=Breznakibacter xylanolyticus TaxID=990 RepID=A0A2W7PSK0_9BACT|nr:16S rRNA (cytosine(1402)-N(4))-methyltransferase RsmH [Breznakibacter xylanolyticus]MBN2743283.1 16S rRNA (cytosine(1402)-N(4))-methyltransferase RsmH [Marinilabiliaceae bacterium]PZX12429.1 16S rRNA (cytosine1402-N4)-methyltransferase [Breznakibacter xylanolyticus]
MEEIYHIPALLHPTVDGLAIRPGGVYVDLTFGGGGHSQEILSRLDAQGKLVVFDQDPDAFANRPHDDRLIFVRHNFRYLGHFLRYLGIDQVDGVLGDLGVSSHHFDSPERGFSFRFDGALDMRMNQVSPLTAADILNKYSHEQLINMFRTYGELQQAGRLVSEVMRQRTSQPFATTSQLRELAEKLAPKRDQSKYLAQVFQALRIEVNGEMDVLREMLQQTVQVIRPGGRLVIISYHSLEDRMVKNFIKSGDCTVAEAEKDIYGNVRVPFTAVNRKVIVPDEQEIERNPRARSAKLRIAEKNVWEG